MIFTSLRSAPIMLEEKWNKNCKKREITDHSIPVCLSLFIHLSVCLFLPLYLSVSVYLSLCLSISVCLSVCLSISLLRLIATWFGAPTDSCIIYTVAIEVNNKPTLTKA